MASLLPSRGQCLSIYDLTGGEALLWVRTQKIFLGTSSVEAGVGSLLDSKSVLDRAAAHLSASHRRDIGYLCLIKWPNEMREWKMKSESCVQIRRMRKSWE